VHVLVNPGGTNERFDRAHLQKATMIQWSDNATIFDALVEGKADLMITDAVESINGSTCSIFRASIRRSSPEGCLDVFRSYDRP
jgi:hypothetical protein